jgi:hypothetical protein
VAGLVYNDTVLGRLLDLGDDNCALTAVLLVELGELCEGVVACDIGVQDEEGWLVLAQDALGELEGPRSAERFCLDGELDLDVVLLLVLVAGYWCVCRRDWRVLTVLSASAMISGR